MSQVTNFEFACQIVSHTHTHTDVNETGVDVYHVHILVFTLADPRARAAEVMISERTQI